MLRRILCALAIAVFVAGALATEISAASSYKSKAGKAKGKHRFELEGRVEATSTSGVTVIVKSGSKTIKNLKGSSVDVEITESTGLFYKGERITLEDVLIGDRVHIRGRMRRIGYVPIALTATKMTVKPRKTGSHEDTGTDDRGEPGRQDK